MRVWARFVRLNALIEAAAATQLRDIGLSIPQFDVLSALAQQDGLTQQDIAERLLVTKGNVSGLIDRLTGAGLVERRSTESDRRSKVIHLTERGRALAATGMQLHERFVHETLGRLPAGQRATLERLLMTVRDSVRGDAVDIADQGA